MHQFKLYLVLLTTDLESSLFCSSLDKLWMYFCIFLICFVQHSPLTAKKPEFVMSFLEDHVSFTIEEFCYFSIDSALKTLLNLIYMVTTPFLFIPKTLYCHSTFDFLYKIFFLTKSWPQSWPMYLFFTGQDIKSSSFSSLRYKPDVKFPID